MDSSLFSYTRRFPLTGEKGKRKGVKEEKERGAGERGEGEGESPSKRAVCVLRQGDLRPDFYLCTGKMASPTEENGSTGSSAK